VVTLLASLKNKTHAQSGASCIPYESPFGVAHGSTAGSTAETRRKGSKPVAARARFVVASNKEKQPRPMADDFM
jgi:hypothetical protein